MVSIGHVHDVKADRLTKIIDVEDTADGAARPAMPGLGLARRSRGVVDGRVDLAQRRALFLHFSGHWWEW